MNHLSHSLITYHTRCTIWEWYFTLTQYFTFSSAHENILHASKIFSHISLWLVLQVLCIYLQCISILWLNISWPQNFQSVFVTVYRKTGHNAAPFEIFFLHLQSCRRPNIELSKFYRRSLSRSRYNRFNRSLPSAWNNTFLRNWSIFSRTFAALCPVFL